MTLELIFLIVLKILVGAAGDDAAARATEQLDREIERDWVKVEKFDTDMNTAPCLNPQE